MYEKRDIPSLSGIRNDTKCPTCRSPAPHLHPAVQSEGEVQPCRDDFHRRVTAENTLEQIAELAGRIVPVKL